MKDFSKQTLAILSRKGIRVMGATMAQVGGIWDSVYNVDDNGTHRVLSFMGVIALAS